MSNELESRTHTSSTDEEKGSAAKDGKKPKRVFTAEEAKKHLSKIAKAITSYANWYDRLRLLIYVMFECQGLKALGKNEDQFRKYISKKATKQYHRSYINRLTLAALGDHHLGLPPGELTENAHRDLRTNVKREHREDVILKAWDDKGSLGKVSGEYIKTVAKELGYLEPSSREEVEVGVESGEDAGAEDESWPSDSSNDKQRVTSEVNKRQLIEKAGRGLSEPLAPVYKAITKNEKNIPVMRRILALYRETESLAQLLAGLSSTDMWTLIGCLDEILKPHRDEHNDSQ